MRKFLGDHSETYDGSLESLTSFATSFTEPMHRSQLGVRERSEFDSCQWAVPDEDKLNHLTLPPIRAEIMAKLKRATNMSPDHDGLEYCHLQKYDLAV